jgi:hypothetical protein
MTEKPPEPMDEKEAEDRFNETLGRLVNTPHKPHKGSVNEPSDDGGDSADRRHD